MLIVYTDEILGLELDDIRYVNLWIAKLKAVGVSSFRLIGSRLRGDYREDSDIDIVALYPRDFSERCGKAIAAEIFEENKNRKIHLSMMLFPEKVEHYTEVETEAMRSHKWVPKILQSADVAVLQYYIAMPEE